MTRNEDPFNDVGIRVGAQDIEWMLSSVDLMLATSLATGCSEEAKQRMKAFRDQLVLQSALPRHSGAYSDSFRYSDAIAAVRGCDAWEARLVLDRKSYFKDCHIAIETHKDGKRSQFKLTSELRLGRDSDLTPYDKYGVYLNRLVDICQSVAPPSSAQIEECRVRLLADWHLYLEKEKVDVKKAIATLIHEAVEAAGPFVVRDVDLARWTVNDEKSLPEHLRYLEVTVSATSEGYARLSEFAADYNDGLAAGREWSGPSALKA